MNVKGFIELHDWYAHAPFIVNVNAIESVEDRFIIYAQSGHSVDERYDEILKLMEGAQAEAVEGHVCSECGLSSDYGSEPYCPLCARMIGDKNDR